VLTTAIEHKAVLEPCAALEPEGFAVTRLPVTAGGFVDPAAVRAALRPDTGLVSVMAVNNKTGVPGLDSEALMVALKDLIAISNGSAGTSTRYTPSPVLKAMGLDDDQASAGVRISWSHLTPAVDWEAVAARIRALQ